MIDRHKGPSEETTNNPNGRDDAFRRMAIGSLTRAGVTFHGHRFYGTRIPTLRCARGHGNVQIADDVRDCSFILVFDAALRENVRLSNCDAKFSSGLSWMAASIIRNFARVRGPSFGSDLEKHAARVAFSRSRSVLFIPQ
jgi:hypothetical protein